MNDDPTAGLAGSANDSTARRNPLLGRRTLLKVLGATAAVGATLPATAAAVGQGGRIGVRNTADVIVIGAGYAGATTARQLSAAGLSVLVLEGRDRIGGSTWTTTFAGKPIELGGQWLTTTQPHVKAELDRYGVPLYADSFLNPERAFFPGVSGQAAQVDFIPAITRQGELLAKVMDGSDLYFPRPMQPLYARTRLARVDPLSLRQRIDQLGLSPLDDLYVGSVTGGYSGGSSAAGGLAGMAQWWALGGHTNAGWDSQTQQRPVGGMSAIARRMLADSRAMVKLNTRVTHVGADSSKVVVVTEDGAKYLARAVVVATPVNMWKSITFAPGLPPVHAAATRQGVGVANSTKMWLRLAPETGATFACGPEGAPVTSVIPKETLDNGDILALGFSESNTAFDSLAAVQNAVRSILPGARVLDYRAQAWSRDPFTRGGWGMRKPNQYLGHLPAIQQPHGRVHFAGADIADGWYGAFIDGAIESGFRASAQVINLL
ncbi:flavin monoamine oxidase family protein [Actinokineospora pegani]|uniref:flavin monoamine oxidase family protein n=1 Tax=Actinokineospora pegani TaxID=2654637 RepID=UPI0012EA5B37|nr:NAD(P)/FAD-dependent oxidoreductase [Actinokineospora pegani]